MLFIMSSKLPAINIISLSHSFVYTKWVLFQSINTAQEQDISEKKHFKYWVSSETILTAGNKVEPHDKNNSKDYLCIVCFLPVVE